MKTVLAVRLRMTVRSRPVRLILVLNVGGATSGGTGARTEEGQELRPLWAWLVLINGDPGGREGTRDSSKPTKQCSSDDPLDSPH